MLHQSFDIGLVFASLAIATLAAYAALAFSGRMAASQGNVRLAWLIGGGSVLGLGIAAMHFVGMLALEMPAPVTYSVGLTVLSLAIAIVASTAALTIAGRPALRFARIATGGMVAGIAIAGMHFVGMSAMQGPFVVHYDLLRVAESVAVAVGAAAGTLWFAHRADDNVGSRGTVRRIAGALALGFAIAGMHYTAMSAAHFESVPAPVTFAGSLIGDRLLGVIVSAVCYIVIAVAILVAAIDRRANWAAREVAAAGERYRRIAEALQEIVWTATPDGHIDYCNRAWFAYSGMTLEQTAGMAWTAAIHPDDLGAAAARWSHSIASGDAYDMEYRVRRGSDGAYRWHRGRATALLDQNGIVEKWLGTTTDIHEQKCAEDALRDGQRALESTIADTKAEAAAATELYRLLAENATDMVSTHGADGCFDYVTPSWSEFTGFSPEELTGQPPAKLAHPDDVELLVANYHSALTSDDLISTAWRCRKADGSYGWLETSTRTVRTPESRRVRAFVCATRDITERRRAEAAIRDSEARYRQLVEHAADAILVANADGHCIEANARACAMLGRLESDLIGINIRALFIARDPEHGSLLSSLRVGDAVTAEDVAVRGDDSQLAVEISVAMLPGGRTQIIARDISGRKELERMKGEFISVVSHELRTPLTSIRGALGLLASGRLSATPATSARMLDLAVTNTDRLIRLINDILDAERIESGVVSMERIWCDATDLARQVADALRPVAERAGVAIDVVGGATSVWADADRLTQTLTNLVGNAIKFSPANSTVEVHVSSDASDVRLEVRDRGRGIPADKLEGIFDRFQQVDASDAREKGGSGLGLAISRSIVRQHGGKIWAESNAGGGSVFCVTLPLPPTTQTAPASRPASTVLVCDDDPGFLEVVGDMLERHGYSVSTVTSGEELIARCAASPPKAILLDLVLPGMSGRETLEMLRADAGTRDIPVIVMSGAMPVEDARRVGAVDWLSKPIDETTLTRAMSRIVNPAGSDRSRILVVEDDRALAQVMATTLESRGYAVNVAHSGTAALACYHTVGADLIIVDLGLPDMSGLDVLEWIHADAEPRLPAIMYTAADIDVSLRDRVRDAGAVLAIKSRTSPEALAGQVAQLLLEDTVTEPAAA